MGARTRARAGAHTARSDVLVQVLAFRVRLYLKRELVQHTEESNKAGWPADTQKPLKDADALEIAEEDSADRHTDVGALPNTRKDGQRLWV